MLNIMTTLTGALILTVAHAAEPPPAADCLPRSEQSKEQGCSIEAPAEKLVRKSKRASTPRSNQSPSPEVKSETAE